MKVEAQGYISDVLLFREGGEVCVCDPLSRYFLGDRVHKKAPNPRINFGRFHLQIFLFSGPYLGSMQIFLGSQQLQE